MTEQRKIFQDYLTQVPEQARNIIKGLPTTLRFLVIAAILAVPFGPTTAQETESDNDQVPTLPTPDDVLNFNRKELVDLLNVIRALENSDIDGDYEELVKRIEERLEELRNIGEEVVEETTYTGSITSSANVREGDSTTTDVVVTTPAGTEVTVIGRNEAANGQLAWVQIELENGTLGWVREDLLTVDDVNITELPVVEAETVEASAAQEAPTEEGTQPGPEEDDATDEPRPTEAPDVVNHGGTNYDIIPTPENRQIGLEIITSQSDAIALITSLQEQNYPIFFENGKYYYILGSEAGNPQVVELFINTSENAIVAIAADGSIAFSEIIVSSETQEGAFAELENGIYDNNFYNQLLSLGLNSPNIEGMMNASVYPEHQFLVFDSWDVRVSDYDIPELFVNVNGQEYIIDFSHTQGVHDTAIVTYITPNGEQIEGGLEVNLSDIVGTKFIVPIPYGGHPNDIGRNNGWVYRSASSLIVVGQPQQLIVQGN
jgi:hypothetical protein